MVAPALTGARVRRAWTGGTRVASRRELPTPQRLLLGGIAIVAALGLWELATDLGWVSAFAASSPSRIVRSAVHLSQAGELVKACRQTVELFVVGFGLSLVTGIVIGVLVGWYVRVGAVLEPFVSIFYAAPRIALIPLITVWSGIGFTAQVVIVWLTAVFPIIINVSTGVRAIDQQLLAVARSFRASNAQVLRTLALPGAIPHLVSGVRQGLAQALIGVVVAEYFVGNNGVGGLIVNAGNTLDSGAAFVGVIIFAAAALLLTAGLRAVERRFDSWRTQG